MAQNLTETTVILIRDYLKANMAQALASIRTERADAQVTTEAPKNNNYFIAPRQAVYNAPGVFIISDRIDFRLGSKQANHINALVRVYVSVVVEDRDTTRLTIKAYRYQAALHQLLAQTSLTTATNDVKLIVKVTDATYSPEYTNAQKSGDPQGVFRKEVLLTCEVEHYENYV